MIIVLKTCAMAGFHHVAHAGRLAPCYIWPPPSSARRGGCGPPVSCVAPGCTTSLLLCTLAPSFITIYIIYIISTESPSTKDGGGHIAALQAILQGRRWGGAAGHMLTAGVRSAGGLELDENREKFTQNPCYRHFRHRPWYGPGEINEYSMEFIEIQ